VEWTGGDGDGADFTQVGNLGAFVSAHPHLNLTQRKAVLLAHRLIQESVIEFVVTYNSGPGLGSAKPV
jgi:hypothetical protein